MQLGVECVVFQYQYEYCVGGDDEGDVCYCGSFLDVVGVVLLKCLLIQVLLVLCVRLLVCVLVSSELMNQSLVVIIIYYSGVISFGCIVLVLNMLIDWCWCRLLNQLIEQWIIGSRLMLIMVSSLVVCVVLCWLLMVWQRLIMFRYRNSRISLLVRCGFQFYQLFQVFLFQMLLVSRVIRVKLVFIGVQVIVRILQILICYIRVMIVQKVIRVNMNRFIYVLGMWMQMIWKVLFWVCLVGIMNRFCYMLSSSIGIVVIQKMCDYCVVKWLKVGGELS